MVLSRYLMAQVYLEQPRPDPDLAKEQLERVIEAPALGEDLKTVSASSILLAKIYAKKNLTAKFIEALKNAIAADPSNPEPYCLIGENIDMSSQAGREQVREYCGKCVDRSTGPGNERLTRGCRGRMMTFE